MFLPKEKSFTKTGQMLLKHSLIFLEKSSAICPHCGYDYSKINYTELGKKHKYLLRNVGIEPAVDWNIDRWADKTEMIGTYCNWRDKKPYRISCLNCGGHLTYFPETDILEKVNVIVHKKKIFSKTGQTFLTHSLIFLEKSSAICPFCNYDYSKIDYIELSKKNEHMVGDIGNEPMVNWVVGPWKDLDLLMETSHNCRDKKPYKVHCLNCDNIVIYNQVTDTLEKVK